MKLSVVIPTLNRLDSLKVTLDFLLPQVKRNLTEVEIVISINASEDNTYIFLTELVKSCEFIRFYNFENRVEISESFSRSVDLCFGDFILIFGDDDIPSPYLIDYLLDLISKYDQIGLIHYNRLVASEKGSLELFKARVEQTSFTLKTVEMEIGEFIETLNISPGFISSMIFKKSSWIKGVSIDNSDHFGYEFLSRIYFGIYLEKLNCLYLSFPLVIQRMVKTREWNDKWPKYWLLGVPNLLDSMDRNGVSKTALNSWHSELNKSVLKFLYTVLWASNYKFTYIPLIPNIQKFQKNIFRKILVLIFIIFSPKALFSWIRKILYKS